MSGSVGNETLQDIIESCVGSVGKSTERKNSSAISKVSSAHCIGETVIPFSGLAIQRRHEWWRRMSMSGSAVR